MCFSIILSKLQIQFIGCFNPVKERLICRSKFNFKAETPDPEKIYCVR